jgi:hypothetical protein
VGGIDHPYGMTVWLDDRRVAVFPPVDRVIDWVSPEFA